MASIFNWLFQEYLHIIITRLVICNNNNMCLCVCVDMTVRVMSTLCLVYILIEIIYENVKLTYR